MNWKLKLNDRLKGTSPLVSHEQTIIDAHEFYTLYKELIGTKISSIHVSNLYMQLATVKYYSAIDMDKQGSIQMWHKILCMLGQHIIV